jgi:acyl dehydratase
MAAPSAVGYLKNVIRLAARELRDRGGSGALRGERLVLERWGLSVQPRRLKPYLKTTWGTGIERFHGADALLPPLYPAVWEAGLALELLSHPRAPSIRRGVIHLESELLQVRPLRVSDSFRCRLELERAEADPRGMRLHLLTRTWNASGHLGSECRSVMLVRGATARPSGGAPRADDTPAADPGAELARWKLGAGHGRRYARASGDYNPIHLWRLTALALGFRRPILHGFCTGALVAHALIEHLYGGRPEALRRLRISFRSPLFLPAEACLLVSQASGGAAEFRVVGKRDGTRYAEGEFSGV